MAPRSRATVDVNAVAALAAIWVGTVTSIGPPSGRSKPQWTAAALWLRTAPGTTGEHRGDPLQQVVMVEPPATLPSAK